MKLAELLNVIEDCHEIIIYGCYGGELGRANMRDSIPSYLNDEDIENLTVDEKGTIHVHMCCEQVTDLLDHLEGRIIQMRSAIQNDSCKFADYEDVRSGLKTFVHTMADDCMQIEENIKQKDEWNYLVD